jgi:hypothetical protein
VDQPIAGPGQPTPPPAQRTIEFYRITCVGQGIGPANWRVEYYDTSGTPHVAEERKYFRWGINESKVFRLAAPVTGIGFRIVITDLYAGGAVIGPNGESGEATCEIVEAQFYNGPTPIECASGEGSSEISYADAFAKAQEAARTAARAKLSCMTIHYATDQYIAQCSPGTVGPDVTRNVSVISLNSIAEAQEQAHLLARDAAIAALQCGWSINSQSVQLANGTMAKATPYASTQFYEDNVTIGKLRVKLRGVRLPEDVHVAIMIKGPHLAQGAMLHRGPIAGPIDFDAEIIFDDDAAEAIPETGAVSGGSYKTTPGAGSFNMPSPAVAGPYGADLSGFIGVNSQGSWSLWVVTVAPTPGGSGGTLGVIYNGWELLITPAA